MIWLFNRYVSPKSVMLMTVECICMMLAVLLAAKLRFWGVPDQFELYIMPPGILLPIATFVISFQACFYICDLYDLSILRPRTQELVLIGQSLGAGCLLSSALYYLFPPLLIGRGVFAISFVLLMAFVVTSRLAFDAVWRLAMPRQNVLILGTGSLAVAVAREILERRDLNVCLTGFLDIGPGWGTERTLCGAPVMGATESLQSVVAARNVSRIIVALEDRRGRLPTEQLVRVRVSGVRVEDAHSTVAALTGRVWLRTVQPSWFVFSDGFRRSRLTLALKRFSDVVLSSIGLILSAPLMLLVALAVRLNSSGPVIFRQERVGIGGKPFSVLKFRSMRMNAEQSGEALWATSNDARVTPVGRILRKFRLDEMPQLINVLRGEMSFVGPRPERPQFVDQLRKEIPYYDERHSIRPGLTGWAQVRYHYGATVEDARCKLEFDLFYAKNMSVFFDGLIVLKTIRIVLTAQGGQ